MKNKKVFGLIVLAAILMIVCTTCYILSKLSVRVDLTAEKINSLTLGTKHILGKLDKKVTLKFFFSKSYEKMPSVMKELGEQVHGILNEYERLGNGKIVVETYDPNPDSDEEKWAIKYGVKLDGVPFCFALVAVCGERDQSIPIFLPEKKPSLEYDITRLITRVAWPDRPVVGILSSISGVLGEQHNPVQMQMRQLPSPGWIAFSTMLKKDYDIREIQADATVISNDVKTLIVLHPKNLSEKTLFAIDQFVIRGGRLIVCVDPVCNEEIEEFRSNSARRNAMLSPESFPGPSSLDKLFKAWGVSFDTSKFVKDDEIGQKRFDPFGRFIGVNPICLDLNKECITNDVLTTGLNHLRLDISGSFNFTPTEGLTFTPILTSTTNASLVAREDVNNLSKIKPDGVRHTLAARLEGTFKTAFPKGPDWTEGSSNAIPNVVQASTNNASVFLFADADFLANGTWAQFGYVPTQRQGNIELKLEVLPNNDNYTFFANIVEQFAGHEELIGLRTRKSDRPFKVVQDLRAKAANETREKEEELKKKEEELKKKIKDLIDKHGNNRQLLSREAEDAVKQFNEELSETYKELRNVEKKRDAEIKRLGRTLKIYNIVIMPLLVILFGIGHAFIRRKR